MNEIFGEWINNLDSLSFKYKNAQPYPHIIIPNFLNKTFIDSIFDEYPNDFTNWHIYNNPLEVKYAYDNISLLGNNIQKLFQVYSEPDVIDFFNKLTGNNNLQHDPVLHGSGLHVMPKYGRLSVHLDYEKHPVLENKQRKLNVILYLNKEWKSEWNGSTELWNDDCSECVVESKVMYNTAIIFNTDNNSWHGVPKKINCPIYENRKTIAYYYLSELENKPDTNKVGNDGSGYRTKATYINKTPHSEVDHFIKIRPFRRIDEKDLKNIWPEWNKFFY